VTASVTHGRAAHATPEALRAASYTTTRDTAQAQDTEMVMIDATHLKTHRTASRLAVQKGGADG